MASQISMIGGEYNVRTITDDEFDVIYTRGSATVKACLARFLRMFNSFNISKSFTCGPSDFHY